MNTTKVIKVVVVFCVVIGVASIANTVVGTDSKTTATKTATKSALNKQPKEAPAKVFKQVKADSKQAQSYAQNDVASDEILSRLMQYEERILELEDKSPTPPKNQKNDEISTPSSDNIEITKVDTESTDKIDSKSYAASLHQGRSAKVNNELKEHLTKIQTQLDSSQAVIAELKSVRPSTKELRAIRDKNREKEIQIKQLQERIFELEHSKTVKIDSDSSTAPNRANNIELGQISQLKKENKDIASNNDRLETQNGKLVNQVIEYRSKIRKYEKKLRNNESGNLNTTRDLDNSNADLSQLRRDYAALEKKLRESQLSKVSFSDAHVKLAKSRTTIERLENKLERLKNSSLNNGYLRAEIERLHKKVDDRDKSLKKAKSHKPQLDAALVDIKRIKQSKAKKIANLESKIQKFTLLVAKLETKHAETKLKEAELGAELKETKNSLEKKNELLVSKGNELKAGQKGLTEANQQLSRTINEAKQCHLNKDNELVKLKNELMLKDTEITRLSEYPGQKTRLARTRSRTSPQAAAQKRSSLARPSSDRTNDRTSANTLETDNKSDVLIAQVSGQKVNLRSGPGTEHSPVMQIQKGTRLMVESRSGDWYRVLSPTGSRAYVRRDMVQVIGNNIKTAATLKKQSELVPFGKTTKAAASTQSKEELVAFEKLKSALKFSGD